MLKPLLRDLKLSKADTGPIERIRLKRVSSLLVSLDA